MNSCMHTFINSIFITLICAWYRIDDKTSCELLERERHILVSITYWFYVTSSKRIYTQTHACSFRSIHSLCLYLCRIGLSRGHKLLIIGLICILDFRNDHLYKCECISLVWHWTVFCGLTLFLSAPCVSYSDAISWPQPHYVCRMCRYIQLLTWREAALY